MSEEVNFSIPRKLTLNNYEYSYKDELKNNYYTYRCKHRTKCGVVIKIAKAELVKYNNKNYDNLEYTITSKAENHTCIKNEKEKPKNSESENKINYNKDLIKAIILNNIDKPLNFHLEN